MDFYYDPILGLQWFGGLRTYNVWYMDEIGQFPVNQTSYILTNANTDIFSKFKTTIK